MRKFIDTLTLRDYKRRVETGTADIELLTLRGDQMHIISLCLVFLYTTFFSITNFYYENFPQAYLTLIPIPLSVLFYFFFRWGGTWAIVSKLANLTVLLSLLVTLKLLDGPSTGILSFFIPVIVGSMITFQGKQRIFSWVGVSISLLVLLLLLLLDNQLKEDPNFSTSQLKIEQIQNFFGAALATVFQVGFLIWVSNQLQDKLLEIEQEKRRLDSKLTFQLLEKQQNEVAVELHENINQILAAAKVNLSHITPTDVQADTLRETETHIEYAVHQIRKLYHTLVTPDLHGFALTDLIRELLDELFSTDDIRILVDTRIDAPQAILYEIKLVSYRVALEYLQFIRLHPLPNLLEIQLKEQAGGLLITIRHEGGGFDPAETQQSVEMRSIRNRVTLHYGSLDLQSKPGKGGILSVLLPLTKN